MSYRRDAVDKDYLNEFYEKLISPEDRWLAEHDHKGAMD